MSGLNYTVVSGDCLSGIAKRFGFQDYQTIYNHPDNSSFKVKRPNPNLIYPGDIIVIPDKSQKSVNVAVGSSSTIKIKRQKQLLRVKMSTHGEPLKDAPFTLFIKGRNGIADYKIEGKKTDGQGVIAEKIPTEYIKETGETSAEIIIYGIPYLIKIGGLDPISTVSGVKQRLKNLGYSITRLDNQLGPEDKNVIELFQFINEMEVNGNINDKFRQKLHELHDNSSDVPAME